MKRIYLAFLFLCLAPIVSEKLSAQTTLVAGDIAFTGYDSEPTVVVGGPYDVFSFVILRVGGISSGTTINFTDCGYINTNPCGNGTDNFFPDNATSESSIAWTSASALPYGTQVTITGPGASSGNVAVGSTAFGLSFTIAGDQVIAYQGTRTTGTVIAALSANIQSAATTTDAAWDAPISSTSASAIPLCLTNGVNAVILYSGASPATGVEMDNEMLTCFSATGNRATDLAYCNNRANWVFDDNVAYTLPPAACASPLSATISGVNLTCNGVCTGSSSVVASGGVAPYTYSWAPSGGSGATASSLCAQNYTCTITDAASTSITKTVSITQPSAIVITPVSQTNVACFGGSNGAAQVSSSGGTGTLSYNWTPGTPTGDGTGSVSGLTAGNWTVTVTDANSCTAARTFTVTQPSAAVSGTTVVTNVACNGGSNGAIDLTPAGGTPGYTYQWLPSGPTTQDRTSLAAGTYSVQITDVNSCTGTVTITVTQPIAITANISKADVSCNSGSNGIATVSSVAGGTPGYTYSWAPSGGTAATATGLASGTYTCTITDANSCQITKTITVNQPTALASTISKTDVSCNSGSNGTATVSASGGTPSYTYSWAPSGGTGATATGLAVGVYTCTITDANSCQITKTVTVTQPTALASTISKTDVSCNGGSNGTATVSASGGTPSYTYSWAPSGGTAATATGLSIGVYTCTITDANSCQITKTVTINQPTALASTISKTDVSCNSGSNGIATVSASGGTPSYTYSWAPSGGTAATATGLAIGVYTCTITDANSCQITKTVTVTQPTALASTISKTDVSCNGGSNGTATVSASGGTPSYTYSWAPSGGTAATATGLAIGVYTCTITDANSCQITKTVTVNQPTALASTISKTDVSCNGGSNGTATVSPSGGTPGYTYSWAPSGGTAATATGLAVGVYTCTITDANSCQITKTVTVNQPTAISSSISSSTDVNCNGGSNGSATVSLSGGTPSYTYSWAPSGGTGATASGLGAGTYTCTITDANSCTKTQTVTITQPSAITSSVSSSTNVSCNGGSNGSATVSVSGGSPGYSYNWAPSGGNSATATNLTAGTYTCIISDSHTCISAQVVTITQPVAITTSISSSTSVSCNGGNNGAATISASGGTGTLTYSWTPSGQTGATATNLSAGTYTCVVTDANSCTASRIVTITQPTLLSASSSSTAILCNGGSSSITVSASGGTPSYSGTGTFTHTAGTYTYTVTDANGCTATTNITITEPSVLSASSSSTSILCNGGSSTVTVTASGGTAAYSGTGTFTETAGTYTYTVTDANGCTAATNITITEPSMLSASSSSTSILCNGGSSAVTVTASGGTAGYSGTGTFTETAGTYTYTVTDANGCTAATNITITEPSMLSASSSATTITCNGGSATVTVSANGGTAAYSGTGTFTETAGTYTYTVVDANGCSTSTNITVTEPAAIASSQTFTVCAGGSVTVGTNMYNTSGTYTDVLTAANGCDSTVTTNLTVNSVIVTNQSVSLCSGQSITVGANTYNTSGSYTDVLTAANGCDSTVNTNLTVASQITFTQNPTVCAGGSITVGTHTYSVSGTYVDTLTAMAGCDSIVTTNLTVSLAIDNTTTLNAETITANATGATYQWIDCDNGGSAIAGETNQSYTATANGNYAVIITYGSCSDTSACVAITTVSIKESKTSTVAISIYPNPSAGLFNLALRKNAIVTVVNALGSVVWQSDLHMGINAIDLQKEPNGVYFVKVQSEGKIQILKIVKQD